MYGPKTQMNGSLFLGRTQVLYQMQALMKLDTGRLHLQEKEVLAPITHYQPRLVNDPASSIVYHLSGDYADMATVNQVWAEGDLDGPSISMNGNINTFYPSIVSVHEGADPWNSANLTTIPMSQSFLVQNSGCDGSIVFTVTTVDSQGEALTYTGTDNLEGPVPSALPANLTVTNGNDTSVCYFYYTDIQPISVAFGSAECESVRH
jgi:hypothetical protein